jgi:hypothetical protein
MAILWIVVMLRLIFKLFKESDTKHKSRKKQKQKMFKEL